MTFDASRITHHAEPTAMIETITIGNTIIGDGSLALIAGPCVIESREMCLEVAGRLAQFARGLGMPYIFKASFDKANRTSGSAFRGPGLEAGLETLAAVKAACGAPVLT